MRRLALSSLFVLLSGGCSLAARAAGASERTVADLRDLDGLLASGLVSVAGAAVSAAVAGAEISPPIPEDAYMCWLDGDGGVEIYARSDAHAEALCRARWGERPPCRCESIGGS